LKECSSLSAKEKAKFISEFTGVSMASVFNANKQMEETSAITTTGNKRKREQSVPGKCNNSVRCAVRTKMKHQHWTLLWCQSVVTMRCQILNEWRYINFSLDLGFTSRKEQNQYNDWQRLHSLVGTHM
jgi:hypothetical protein